MKRNLNWMRCCPNTQAPVNNAGIGPLKTTNLQAIQFADSLKLGTVNLLDVLAATTGFGFGCGGTGAPSSTCYFAHPLYSTGLQSQCRTGNTAPCDDIGVVSTIASYFGAGTTAPFLGTSTGFLTATPPSILINYDPNVDPFAYKTGTSTTTNLYNLGCARVSTSVSCAVLGTFTNGAHLGALTAVADTSVAGRTSWTFTNVASGTYLFSVDGTAVALNVQVS
jgi:hypothetical protein